jgi:hypothetical protein
MAESDRTASLMSPATLAKGIPKAPASPAAWLNQMAADAGHQHVKRIGELGEILQEQVACPELATLAVELERLSAALPRLDFSLLESRGWWARTSGKARSSGAEFSTQFQQIDEATRSVIALGVALRREQQADAALSERALVELEVEYQAVEKIIDQGARWLQDMRSQLKLRQAAASDLQDQQKVLEDAQRCDILVQRLKLLRAVCNAAANVPALARASAQNRLSLAQALQQSLASDVKNWHGRVSALSVAGTAGKGPALGLHGPMECHEELQSSVRKAVAGCEQLLAQEQALAQSLATLRLPHAPPA